jgi:adenosine/AMP kinase
MTINLIYDVQSTKHYHTAGNSYILSEVKPLSSGGLMELQVIQANIPTDTNIIIGMSHFIKTVEDIYELMVSSLPNAKFGVAFCEASGVCLIRAAGTDKELKHKAIRNAEDIGAGHSFVIIMKGCFPINIMHALKSCHEVVHIFCATANPVQVIVAETEQGRGIMGVIDGSSPKGVETKVDEEIRMKFLRDIGYKMG